MAQRSSLIHQTSWKKHDWMIGSFVLLPLKVELRLFRTLVNHSFAQAPCG
jgi:hypothetical protein